MAILLKTKELADQISRELTAEVNRLKTDGMQPAMAVILVKGNPASEYYAKIKGKIAGKLGISYRIIPFEPDVTEQRLLQEIERLNDDRSVQGIMLELPVPKHINVRALSDSIAPGKDVDGISAANKLACVTGSDGIYPATPLSCIRIMKHFGIPLQGANVVLVGCGETVGKPLLHLLLRENATLTVCHYYTKDLSVHIQNADILITAAGCPGLVTREMVHSGLNVIDVGINETANGITGDVAPDVAEVVKAMTPVPGGVGTLTTMLLFENFMKAVKLQHANLRYSYTSIS